MVAFSIIVPVYNAEDTLDKVLNSLISQDFFNKEIILVDDGSTDSSANICDLYASKYEFVKSIHKKNNGVSSARNTGIFLAKNEWLLFLDADDLLCPQALIKYADQIKRHPKVDVFAANFIMENDNVRKIFIKEHKSMLMDSPLYEITKGQLYLRPGNFITRERCFFNTNISLYEDTAYVFELLQKKSLYYSNFNSMIYSCNLNGASRQKHNYKNEWIYNIDSEILKSYYCYFFRHFAQRIYSHLKANDFLGIYKLLVEFIHKSFLL